MGLHKDGLITDLLNVGYAKGGKYDYKMHIEA